MMNNQFTNKLFMQKHKYQQCVFGEWDILSPNLTSLGRYLSFK